MGGLCQNAPVRKIKKMIYLDPDQDAALKTIALATRHPQSLLIRDGVDLLIKSYGKILEEQKAKKGRKKRS